MYTPPSDSPTLTNFFTRTEQDLISINTPRRKTYSNLTKTKLYRMPTDCITLLHFHSHHTLSCKEGIIYSQALRYNMIITEDHILKEELSNLTRILLAHAYPLHLIIKNIKELLTRSRNYLLCQPTPHTETNILSIRAPFSDIGKQLTAIIHRNWHNVAKDTTLNSIWPSKSLSAYTKSNSIHNHLVNSAQQIYGPSGQDS